MRISKEAHKQRNRQRKARRTTYNEQYDQGKGLGLAEIMPPAAWAKRKQHLNRHHRRVFYSNSFQNAVKREQAAKALTEQREQV